MTRSLVIAALLGAATTSAFAQANPPANANNTAASGQIISAQASDEWLASSLKGTTVIGSDNQKIGEVSDVLVDRSGQVRGFLVGVGGLLGVGAKQVAIDMTAFEDVPTANGKSHELKVPMTKDQAQRAAEFKPLPTAATTTGAAPATNAMPPGTPTPIGPPTSR